MRLLRLDLSPERPLVVTCSIGIGAARPGDHPSDVMRRADLAMSSAKRSGQDPIAAYDESMAEAFDRRNLLLAQLPRAIARGEMRLVYQPLFGLAEPGLAGAETLLRWRHPLLGDTLPVDVLKVDRGFILSLVADSGRQVLDTVVTLAKSLNLLTVAEGVETESQAEAARATGVDLVQGFLFSRPVPPEELFALLPAMPEAV